MTSPLNFTITVASKEFYISSNFVLFELLYVIKYDDWIRLIPGLLHHNSQMQYCTQIATATVRLIYTTRGRSASAAVIQTNSFCSAINVATTIILQHIYIVLSNESRRVMWQVVALEIEGV